MEVQTMISKRIASLPPQATAAEAAKLMREEDVGTVVVLSSEKKPLGIFTDRDLVLRVVAPGRNPAQVKLEEVMSSNPFTVGGRDPVMRGARRMADKGVRRLLVVNGGGVGVGAGSSGEHLA